MKKDVTFNQPKKCMYCLKEKDHKQFNKEHVLPQAFGTYKNNFILKNMVCKECNDYFGNNLDISLARKSYHGIERYKQEPERLKDVTSIDNSFIEITLMDPDLPILKGLIMELSVSQNGKNLISTPKPQIGLRKANGTFDFFCFDKIPNINSLDLDNDYNLSIDGIMTPPGVDYEEAKNALINKGYNLNSHSEFTINWPKDILSQIHFSINKILCRAIAKIALNYFAYFNNEVVFNENFNAIRDFVRNDNGENLVKIEPNLPMLLDEINSKTRRLAHIIAYEIKSNGLLAYVSIFNDIRYEVILSKNANFDGIKNSSGHLFDPGSRSIAELPRSNITHPAQVSLVKPVSIKIWTP